MENEIGFLKGEICNRDGCVGIIDEHETDTNCSCHINPPCSHCTTDRNFCPVCDWQGIDEQRKYVKSTYEINKAYYEKQNKEFAEQRELFYSKYNGKVVIDKLEMRTEPHTHFTQKVIGIFPKGAETQTSIFPKVRGTFGGRFERCDDHSFSFIAYTD